MEEVMGMYTTATQVGFALTEWPIPQRPLMAAGGIKSSPVTLYNTIVALNSDDIGTSAPCPAPTI